MIVLNNIEPINWFLWSFPLSSITAKSIIGPPPAHWMVSQTSTHLRPGVWGLTDDSFFVRKLGFKVMALEVQTQEAISSTSWCLTRTYMIPICGFCGVSKFSKSKAQWTANGTVSFGIFNHPIVYPTGTPTSFKSPYTWWICPYISCFTSPTLKTPHNMALAQNICSTPKTRWEQEERKTINVGVLTNDIIFLNRCEIYQNNIKWRWRTWPWKPAKLQHWSWSGCCGPDGKSLNKNHPAGPGDPKPAGKPRHMGGFFTFSYTSYISDNIRIPTGWCPPVMFVGL